MKNGKLGQRRDVNQVLESEDGFSATMSRKYPEDTDTDTDTEGRMFSLECSSRRGLDLGRGLT